MNEQGKSAIVAMGQRPAGGVTVKAPDAKSTGPLVGTNGHMLPRFVARPGAEQFSTLADQINMWLQGDLSFMDRGPGAVRKDSKDPAQRKRDAMADALDEKS